MPIYVYRCQACGDGFEWMQSVTEKPLEYCTNCGHMLLKRVPQPISIAFKGSGFHVNDYPGNASSGRTDA